MRFVIMPALKFRVSKIALLLTVFGGLYSLCSTCLAEKAASRLDLAHEMSMELETPHTAWATPFAGERSSVLFFSCGRDTYPRDMIELMQRFDLAVDSVYSSLSRGSMVGEKNGIERLGKLLSRKYDVYLFHRLSPQAKVLKDNLPAITKAVHEGAGVVCLGVGGFPKAVEIQPQPAFLAGTGATACTLGKRRVVRLPERPEFPYSPDWLSRYDHWQEKVGRALLWAAKREPAMQLNVSSPRKAVSRDALPARIATIHWSDAPTTPFQLEIVVKRSDGTEVVREERKITQPSGSLGVKIPPARAGRYYIDVRGKAKTGVLAWASQTVEIHSALNVTSVTFEKDWGEIGEAVVGTVTLSKPLQQGEQLRIAMIDSNGRCLVRQTLPSKGKAATFQIPIESWFPALARIDAIVEDRHGEVVANYAFFNVTKRYRNKFHFLIWDAPKGGVAPLLYRELADLGITAMLGWKPTPMVAAEEFAWIPYTTRIQADMDKNGAMKPVCWNDDDAIEKRVQTVVTKALPSRRRGAWAYSLGDEIDVAGSCSSPACMKAYREYLKEQYGDIAKLNRSWKTDYADWGKIELLDKKDPKESAARKAGNYPRWYDRQAFNARNFANYAQRYARAFARIDPEAMTGFEGASRLEQENKARGDYDAIARHMQWWGLYYGPNSDLIRSIVPKGFPVGTWTGYLPTSSVLIMQYWRGVMRGDSLAMYWRWDNHRTSPEGYKFDGFLAAHGGPWPATKELLAATAITRDGLGDLLMHSQMQHDGVAIFYSMPSTYANEIEPDRSYGNLTKEHQAWQVTIRALGLQFNYVTDKMVENGQLDPKEYKILILPHAAAMSRACAEKIKAFVEAGGTVLADVRPAVYDEHLNAVSPGLLDKVFGVVRRGNSKAVRADAYIKSRFSARPVKTKLTWVRIDSTVQLAGGRAFGIAGESKLPMVVVHNQGRGRAVLLNIPICDFPDLRSPSRKSTEVAELLYSMFRRAGVTRPFHITSAGKLDRRVEAVRWRNGEMELVGFYPLDATWRPDGYRHIGTREKPIPVTVKLRRKCYVYHLENHVGRETNSFNLLVGPNRAVFCLLARKNPRVATLAIDPTTPRAGTRITAKVRVPGAQGLHGVKLTAISPAAKPARWWKEVFVVGDTPKTLELPFAWNDTPGEWTFQLSDLYNKEPVVQKITLEPSGEKP